MDDSTKEAQWSIVVHGGAKNIEREHEERHRQGCERALLAGQWVLEAGGHALEAVEAAVRVLEDDETFNAGYGSVPTMDGTVECDAAIMDGATLNFGGIAAARGLRHPISVAASLLAEEPILLVGRGAEQFARAHEAELCDPAALLAPDEGVTDPGCDTVGCVAMDIDGHLAAGTSTGGLRGTMPGRVGDSPLPGCGLYAEDTIGAVALSGDGERIARVTLAAWLMNALQGALPAEAAEEALKRLSVVEGEGGLILIDGQGNIAWAHNSRDFAVAHARTNHPVRAFTRREQDETSMFPSTNRTE